VTYLGIDGGGSKTKFLLVDEELREISRSQSGASNYLSVGRDAAAAAIREGALSLEGPTPDTICGGFAGAGRREGLDYYRGVLEQLFPKSRIRVDSDAMVAYAGAIGLEPGVLLIAGTGSIAIGRQPDGTMIRVGGWGPHFGDEGGGLWIGREAVRVALRGLDSGRYREFADTLSNALNISALPDVVSRWAAGSLGIPEIASLFPVVLNLWPAEPAATLLRSAAAHLKSLTETAMRRVAVTNCPLSVSGSVATHALMRQLIGLPFREAKASAEEGAILLATTM
jgi:N-acetylglucosamine kinase-like BadF-type ATPase